MSPAVEPTLDVERALHAEGAEWVVGCDEVGRGAIAGPVAVGMAAVLVDCVAPPAGLRDSKLLSEKRREALHPLTAEWCRRHAVGLASADEVDRFGIVAALGLAGRRALVDLHHQGVAVPRSVVVLDGSHDWLTPALVSPPEVRTRVKADRDCASVAAASVLAKVHRDRLMVAAHDEHPGYAWASNKGYGSPAHYAGLAEHGSSPLHRTSWLRDPADGA